MHLSYLSVNEVLGIIVFSFLNCNNMTLWNGYQFTELIPACVIDFFVSCRLVLLNYFILFLFLKLLFRFYLNMLPRPMLHI